MKRVGSSIKDWAPTYLDNIKKSLEREIKNKERYIEVAEEKIKTISRTYSNGKVWMEENIAQQKREIRRLETQISGFKARIAKIDSAGALPEQFDKIITSSTHYDGHDVSDKGWLSIYTKTLKDPELRKNIGRFRIMINPLMGEGYDFLVANLDYQRSELHHWAINEARCCLGEWEPDVKATLNGGRLDDFFQLMINYITLSPENHTYTSKDEWYENRRKRNAAEIQKIKDLEPMQTMSHYMDGDGDDDDDEDEDW